MNIATYHKDTQRSERFQREVAPKEATHVGSKQTSHLNEKLDISIDKVMISRNGVVKALIGGEF